uniref:Uncharacterized protein n=1 Tax=Oncorhynchus kisutch TaxID=8019 RepID=A0A8C7K4U3_ONCKI
MNAESEAGRAMQLIFFKEKIAHVSQLVHLNYDAVEAELKSSTVGPVTLNDMKARQGALVKEREKQLAKKEQTKELML